jgi:hypothetical protein
LEETAVRVPRFKTNGRELLDEILDGLLFAGSTRGASFELVRRQDLDVGPDPRLGDDGDPGSGFASSGATSRQREQGQHEGMTAQTHATSKVGPFEQQRIIL